MKKNNIKKKSLKVLIEYECKIDGRLCPLCVRDAIEAYEKHCGKEYRIQNLNVREIK